MRICTVSLIRPRLEAQIAGRQSGDSLPSPYWLAWHFIFTFNHSVTALVAADDCSSTQHQQSEMIIEIREVQPPDMEEFISVHLAFGILPTDWRLPAAPRPRITALGVAVRVS